MLKNGKIYDPSEMRGLEIVDNNIVRDIGMSRIASRKETAFQIFLQSITDHGNQVDPEFDLKKIFFTPLEASSEPDEKEQIELDRLSDLSDQTVIDAYNDNARRYFESLFAKKLLLLLLNSPKKSREVREFMKELKNFLVSEYHAMDRKFLTQWHRARKGESVAGYDSLVCFSKMRKNLSYLVESNHFDTPVKLSKESKKMLLDMYDLHYLTHRIQKLRSYRTHFPNGIIHIYTNENRYFSPHNRGRISQYGFNFENPSLQLGILRSIDQSTEDLRQCRLATFDTRGPDRLYMKHPKTVRHNPEDWLQLAFRNPYNRGYVNGLSGSALLEVRSILFFLLSIRQGRATPDQLDPEALATSDNPLFGYYLLFMTAFLIYFEGGHTFSEMLTVFQLPPIKIFLNTEFKNHAALSKIPKLETWITQQLAIRNTLLESLVESAQFYQVLKFKKNLEPSLQTEISRRNHLTR